MKREGILLRLRASLWLALVALALKAVMPAGFMLDVGHDRQLAITLCGDSAAGVVGTLDLETGRIIPAGEHGADKHDPCPFAVGAAPMLAEAGPAVSAPVEHTVLVAPTPPRQARPATSAAGPPLPARGPPLQA